MLFKAMKAVKSPMKAKVAETNKSSVQSAMKIAKAGTFAMKVAESKMKKTKKAMKAAVEQEPAGKPAIKVMKTVLKKGAPKATAMNVMKAPKTGTFAMKVAESKMKKKTMKAMKADAVDGMARKRPAAVGGEAKGGKSQAQAKKEKADAIQARKKELSSMASGDLKDLMKSKGLTPALKSENVEAVLAFEAKEREAVVKREEDRKKIVAEHKAALMAKDASDLKDLCEQKGLKLGGGKGDKVSRILEHDKKAGVIDKVLAAKGREVRKTELMALAPAALQEICMKKGIDPLVREVMVDRILVNEAK